MTMDPGELTVSVERRPGGRLLADGPVRCG